MITFSNISLQPHGILDRSRANSALGALKLRKDALTRIDTPTGYFASGRMHCYVKDYQGNIRQVTDADGNVEQDNHYYPYGMLMARTYDPSLPIFQTQDPMSGDYTLNINIKSSYEKTKLYPHYNIINFGIRLKRKK